MESKRRASGEQVESKWGVSGEQRSNEKHEESGLSMARPPILSAHSVRCVCVNVRTLLITRRASTDREFPLSPCPLSSPPLSSHPLTHGSSHGSRSEPVLEMGESVPCSPMMDSLVSGDVLDSYTGTGEQENRQTKEQRKEVYTRVHHPEVVCCCTVVVLILYRFLY